VSGLVVGGATSLPFIVTGSQIGVAIDALEPSTAAAFVAAGLVSDRIFPTAALAQLGTMAEGSPPRQRRRTRRTAAAPTRDPTA